MTRNLGPEPEPAPLLYHVNLGAPLWSAGATLALDGDAPRRRATTTPSSRGTARWNRLPGARERVFEHDSRSARTAGARRPSTRRRPGLRLTLRWEAAALPRLHQWVHPAPGIAVLGLEPANCSVLGRAADRAAGRLPVLEPGEERVTRLEVRVEGR